METIKYFSVLISIFTLVFILLQKIKMRSQNLPPSPLALPVIGHLHLLRLPIHRTLQSLSQTLGPIFSLRLGSRLVVVVSSPSAIEECFTKNDIVFANRPDFAANNYLSYARSSLGCTPYGDHWRNLRQLSATEIFSPGRLNMSAEIRREEVNVLLRSLYRASSGKGGLFEKVKLRSLFLEMGFNIIMRMVAGKRYYGDEVREVEKAEEFRSIVEKFIHLGTYPGDFIPFLKWVDWKYTIRVKSLAKVADSFLQDLVDEHLTDLRHGKKLNTMISHLLCLKESLPHYYTHDLIKGFALTFLLAATETSSKTIEWAMSNLLNHPEALKKAREELDAQVGEDRFVGEEDLPNLPYLKNVISETLRLYPVGPLLAPHLSSESCSLGGYHIPRNTMLLVNAWAVQRDHKVWDHDSTSFKPERFESEGGSDQANTYRFFPFGLGRRVCPGMGMANRIMALALGSLIQGFEWKRVGVEEIDMTEAHGITMPKQTPLEALCKPRPIIQNNIASHTL